MGGSALVGADGALLGVGSLLVQEALGPGAAAFPGNMYVPINRLKPIFGELVSTGRLSTPPRPWLGIYTVEHMGQLVVGGISDGGPADRAGLQRGDHGFFVVTRGHHQHGDALFWVEQVFKLDKAFAL